MSFLGITKMSAINQLHKRKTLQLGFERIIYLIYNNMSKNYFLKCYLTLCCTYCGMGESTDKKLILKYEWTI